MISPTMIYVLIRLIMAAFFIYCGAVFGDALYKFLVAGGTC